MKQWTVTYREKSGVKTSVVIEAEDRAGVFAELKNRGINAISITEGAVKAKRSATSGGMSKGVWGVVAALVVVALAGVVWMVMPDEETKVVVKENVVKQPDPLVVTAPKPKKEAPVIKDEPQQKSKERVITPEEQKKLRPGDPGFDPAAHPTILIPKKKKEKVNAPFRNSTEQALIWLASCEPGDPPLPLILIPPGDMKNLATILLTPNQAQEGDTELTKEQREIIDLAKDELRKYVKNGGDPQEFLRYFHDLRESQHMRHSEARNAIMNLLRDGTNDDIAAEFIAKVNADLEAQGIKPVRLSRKKLERHGLLKNENEFNPQK